MLAHCAPIHYETKTKQALIRPGCFMSSRRSSTENAIKGLSRDQADAQLNHFSIIAYVLKSSIDVDSSLSNHQLRVGAVAYQRSWIFFLRYLWLGNIYSIESSIEFHSISS